MFGKGDKKEMKPKKDYSSSEIKSILSKELKVSGNIKAEGKVRIDGQIDGDIEGDFVILGNSAVVNGNVNADVLILQGTIKGNIYAQRLELKSTAVVEGEITAKGVVVEDGASILGKVSSGRFAENSLNQTSNISESGKQ
ncbi:bactofilin family protein [Desulfurobacterium sp.]